ncbi:MAG: ATP-binding cassette domain-containing protein [Eggerthellaceae bacterium]|nr:ATP-binding cassette domain-containing protein [Eggerthellaceae bacterium]
MLLEVRNIRKSFADKRVLEDISFEVRSSQAFGLLGRNGAGKTTLIRIIMGVFPANEGEVLIDGKPIDYETTKIGYLPEERGLYARKKIIDQLIYFAELKGLSKARAIQSIDYWLDRLDMSEYRNKRLDTLSKGNQQKIQLITALVHNPDLIILDEPFSGLDPVNAALIKGIVSQQIQEGKIVLFSSHQMNYVEEFCDNVGIVDHGHMVLRGNLHQIKREYERNKLVVSSTQAQNIIGDCKGISDIVSAIPMDEYKVMLTLTSSGKKKEIMQKLSLAYDIDEMAVYEPSLNDIFIEYAGGTDDEVEEGGDVK